MSTYGLKREYLDKGRYQMLAGRFICFFHTRLDIGYNSSPGQLIYA